MKIGANMTGVAVSNSWTEKAELYSSAFNYIRANENGSRTTFIRNLSFITI